MASSTITLLRSKEWCNKFVFQRQLALGLCLEPLITSANIIKQTIMGPPFSWRWNRQVVTFTCTPGVQDYTQACNFGWIENASVQDLSPAKWFQLSPQISLALDSAQTRPQNISAQTDDLNGNITFRLMPVPDKAYPISITIQQKPTLMTAVTSTWSPIPDEFGYIYQNGLLSLMFMFADDPRFATMNQKFVANLLAAADGLNATQKNIFLNNWAAITGAPMTNQMSLTQGQQALGAL